MIRAAVLALALVCGVAAACGQSNTSDGVAAANASTAIAADDMRAAEAAMTPQSMAQIKTSFAPVVERAAPAVVNVFTRGQVGRTTGDAFFDRFFGVGPREQTSLGSGVIVSPDGVIVTNNHVIENMSEVKVVFADRRTFPAELILTDPKTDLAVLRIEADEPLPFLEFANSDRAEVGDLVLAIGNPFGVGQTVTSGIVSALARTALSVPDAVDYQYFIQTDAAINPGNSGGALVDVDGRLLGVNTAIYSRSGGSNGIGFAVPARLVQQVIATARRGGALTRPWAGASTETVTESLADALGLDRPSGAIINELYKGGPFDRAGLEPGDVVVELDGEPIYDAETLRYRVGVQNEDARAPIVYVRRGESRRGEVVFAAPPETPKPDERALAGRHPMDGVSVANLSPRYNEDVGIDPLLAGVVVTDIRRRSYAARSGLRRGYRVVAVNGAAVASSAELERRLARADPPWEIDVDVGDRIVSWCTTSRGRRCR